MFKISMGELVLKEGAAGSNATNLVNIVHADYMSQIRSPLEHMISQQEAPEVRDKYLWLARYFNLSIEGLDLEPLPIEWNSTDEPT